MNIGAYAVLSPVCSLFHIFCYSGEQPIAFPASHRFANPLLTTKFEGIRCFYGPRRVLIRSRLHHTIYGYGCIINQPQLDSLSTTSFVATSMLPFTMTRWTSHLLLLLCLSLFLGLASAQSSTPPLPSYTLSAGSTTVTSTSVSNQRTTTFTTVVPTTYNISLSASPTSSAPAATSSAPAPIVLNTVLDPGFGVLGAVLILSGLPSAFLGHKNRW